MRVNFGNCEIMGKEEYGDGRNLGKVRRRKKNTHQNQEIRGGKIVEKARKSFKRTEVRHFSK